MAVGQPTNCLGIITSKNKEKEWLMMAEIFMAEHLWQNMRHDCNDRLFISYSILGENARCGCTLEGANEKEARIVVDARLMTRAIS